MTRDSLVAFLTGDREYFVRTLELPPWVNTPLVDFDAHPDSVKCEGDRRALAYRQRLIREIERRGRLRFPDLDHPDEARAATAWDRLDKVAAAVGVDSATWDRIREAAGWERKAE